MSVAGVAAVSDEERRKKSVYYEACTSPYKDDFPILVKCLKSPEPGNPHTRQEAGFLLWHHALEGDDPDGLASAGLVTACVANLDSPEVLPADKACSAGILLALACDSDDEDDDEGSGMAEQLLRARSPSGRTFLEVLHAVLHDDASLARQHCSRLLQALVRQAAPAVLHAMDQRLPYLPTYLAVWSLKEHRDAVVVGAVAEAVERLLEERPELALSVVEAGGVTALMGVVRSHKSEVAVAAALHCLARLMKLEAAVERVISEGGIALLVDVLGPPPRAALENRPDAVQEEEAAEQAVPEPRPSLLAALLRTAQANDDAAGDADSSSGSDAGEAGEGEEAAADAVGGVGDGVCAAGTSRHVAEGAAAPATMVVAVPRLNLNLEGDGTGLNSPAHIGSHTPKGLNSGSPNPSPLLSATATPRGAAVGAAAVVAGGGGRGGGAGGWSSSRTSHRSLGSHGSTSMQARVQLPLIIPGIHSTAANASSSSAASSGATTLAALTARSSASSRLLRVSLTQGIERVAPTADGSGSADAAAAEGDGGSGGSNEAAAAAAPPPPPPLATAPPPPLPTAADLAANRSGLRWIVLPGPEVASRAAACLLPLTNRPERQLEAEVRLASHRILAQVRAVVGPKISAVGAEGSPSGKKANKKKGLGLVAKQTAELARLLGLLKFLSLHNTTRYRIAKLGALPMLVRLYGEANDYLLRNHCQAILANVALLAENGVALRGAKTPEEFLVANPMRLTSYERAVLRIEFPDDPGLAVVTPRH